MSQGFGRVALVSGGSRGIGAATVRKLAADGWDISFCHHHDGSSAAEVEKAASELGVRVLAVEADLTRAAEVASWVQRTEQDLGPVEALVSCAGITRDQPLALLADADWRAVIDTNLDGVFQLCRAVLPAMMERRSGRIVTVSSVSAVYGDAAERGARVTRAGIVGFTRALASQTGRYGIRANAVTPSAHGPPDRHDRHLAGRNHGPADRGDRAAPVRQRRRGRRPGGVPALRRGRGHHRHRGRGARQHRLAARRPGARGPPRLVRSGRTARRSGTGRAPTAGRP